MWLVRLSSIMAAESEASEKELEVYDWEEISKHNHSGSLWLVIDGKVYDVTDFMEEVRTMILYVNFT